MTLTNFEFSLQDKHFQDACKVAGVAITRRQASKYRRGRGLAYRVTDTQIAELHA